MTGALDVLCILLHYQRPLNMRQVIAAWRPQVGTLIVVDNSPLTDDCGNPVTISQDISSSSPASYISSTFDGADDVWRMSTNHHCPIRLAPMLYHPYRYTILADDDLLPGPNAVACLVEHARSLQDRFAAIGQHGRQFRLDQQPPRRYDAHNSPRAVGTLTRCDLVCRVYLTLTSHALHAFTLRQDLISTYGKLPAFDIHDDLLLQLGAQRATSYPSYVVPSNTPQHRLPLAATLPEGPAPLYKRPNHFGQRDAIIGYAQGVGWRRPTAPPPYNPESIYTSNRSTPPDLSTLDYSHPVEPTP